MDTPVAFIVQIYDSLQTFPGILLILIGGAKVVDAEYECEHTSILEQSQAQVEKLTVNDVHGFGNITGDGYQ